MAEGRPTDEEIAAHVESIRQEEAQRRPLVGEQEPLDSLLTEYEGGDPSFSLKINSLKSKFASIRRLRGDGNCFYRAFAYSFFDRLLPHSSGTVSKLTPLITNHTSLLSNAGFESFAYDIFHESFSEMAQISSPSSLLTAFQNPEQSNACVVHVRFMTSAFLKTHADEYEPFLGIPIDQYAAMNIEPMDKEADQVEVIAAVRALGVTINIVYLDRTEGDEPQVHTLSADEECMDGKKVYLLYRPGHYDILYPKQ